MAIHFKVGFIGVGNLSQAIIKGLVESKVINPDHIYAHNRSAGKLQKVVETYGIHGCSNNEEVVESSDIVIIGTKPQDLASAIDPISALFNEKQIVVSLAAGITVEALQKKIPQARIVRVMPNTPSLIGRGVTGFLIGDEEDMGLETVVEDLFSPLGVVLKVEDENKLEALLVSCASGTGFVFELMTYWQDWIEEHGFEPDVARKMTVETFLGAAMLAAQSKDTPIEDLLNKVASKKGTTAAGLQSMRELETERTLRYSFEKAALRNQELAKES